MDDGSQTRTAVAVLFAALAKALDETSKGFEQSFAKHIDQASKALLASRQDHQGALETLSQTRSYLNDADQTEPAWVVFGVVNASEEALPSSGKIQQPSLVEAVHFWLKLPEGERRIASIEMASGRRYDSARISKLAEHFQDRA